MLLERKKLRLHFAQRQTFNLANSNVEVIPDDANYTLVFAIVFSCETVSLRKRMQLGVEPASTPLLRRK